MLTAKQVQSDIIALLSGSELANAVDGQIYRLGYRPYNSQAEDIVVSFIAGLPGQLHTGVVTVNIYVRDIEGSTNGVLREDGRRAEELETLAGKWVESLTTDKSNYKFELAQTIHTYEEKDISQYYISVKLEYEIVEF
jgi:hypothetical protein